MLPTADRSVDVADPIEPTMPNTALRGDEMAGQVLVAYFSRSGNTRRIAKLIHQQVGGTLHEIQPEEPYPDSYNATVDQAKKETQAGLSPPCGQSLMILNRTTRFLSVRPIGGIR